MLQSALVLAALQAVFKDWKVNAVSPSLQTQKLWEFLIDGYSCVNTRIAFDTELLLNNAKTEKVIFKAAIGELKRLSSKIIKMDENNQYGQAMTKPLPYGCIKKQDKV